MLIDEKGRLFGKVNIIDFLIVLFILIVVPMYIIGGKILSAKKTEVTVRAVTASVEVKFTRIMPELAKALKEGDLEYDEGGQPVGRLVKIISNEQQRFIALDVAGAGENKLILAQDSNCREIRAVFELKCMEEGRNLVYRGCLIKIGSPVNFSTDLYNVSGVITDVKR